MPISIRFRLRSKKRNPTHLQIRISVNGYEDAGFMAKWEGEPLYVNPAAWRQKKQELATRDPDDTTNEAIGNIKVRIKAIFQDQKKRYYPVPPTTDSVKYEFCEGVAPVLTEGLFTFPIWDTRRVGAKKPSRKRAKELAIRQAMPQASITNIRPTSSILDAYSAYIKELESRKGTVDEVPKIALGRWAKGLEYVTRYINEVEAGHVPTCESLKLGWLNRYHRWLQKIKAGRHANKGIGTPMSVEQASRYVLKISDVYVWLIEEGIMESNPAKLRSWPKNEDKEVYYFEPEHIEKLWKLKYDDETLDITLWWFKFMCLTGMDYPDAIKYLANPQEYDRIGVGGRKIEIARNKPPHNTCDIPFLPELQALLDEGARPELKPQTINRHVKILAKDVGFKKKTTIKIARKTAGALFLYRGFPIAAVSRILGHDSIQWSSFFIQRFSYCCGEPNFRS